MGHDAKQSERETNNELALKLMLEDLGDDPIYLRLFLSNDPRYEKTVRRTTWEELDSERVPFLGGCY